MEGREELSLRVVFRGALVVITRPRLWPTALRELRAFTPRRWWTQRPFLPLPDPELMRFRMVTAYGDAEAPFAPDDLVTWLEWCRNWHRTIG
ncbi:MAG TPA: hypothetical protein VMW08_12040 [Acidimicrobiales bacterium]|nr:hypothetical protein [Acidimicrobiales bacterium]